MVCFFAAREMADRSDILLQTLEFFSVTAPDIVKVFVGCIIMLLGGMLIVGFWTRFVALVLLMLLAIGGYCWLPQDSQVHFQLESLYGILFFYLLLVGGGQWAVSRRRVQQGQSVLESEQSILASGASRPSIFGDEQGGESVLRPPVTSEERLEEDEPEEETPVERLEDTSEDSDVVDDDEVKRDDEGDKPKDTTL